MKNYLIVGGEYYFAEEIIKALLAKDDKVNVTYIGYHKVDITMKSASRLNLIWLESSLDKVLDEEQDFDGIINLGEGKKYDKDDNKSSLLDATRWITEVLDYVVKQNKKKYCRYLHVSRDKVYGSRRYGPANENSLLMPSSPYAASLASSDMLTMSYHRSYGIPVVIARLCNIYGPNQSPKHLIPRAVEALLSGKQLHMHGEGLNIRDWIYVSDACNAVLIAMQRGLNSEIYNISGCGELSNTAMVDLVKGTIEDYLGCKVYPKVKHVSDNCGNDYRYSLCGDKIIRLGFERKVSMQEGIRRVIDNYLESRDEE